ncbi:hypothetical protein ACH4MA_13905 [Streptomyces roseolus]|uniref:hypothetical protein n=1 Tax=Streptomyces roseolus TaxID=67358 RepID=UPI0037B893A9
MGLGSAVASWVRTDDGRMARAMRRRPRHLPGTLTRVEIVARYSDRTGLSVENRLFHEVFGLFRLAVVAQQISYRYHHGQTRNQAFRTLWTAVRPLDHRCRSALRRAGGS